MEKYRTSNAMHFFFLFAGTVIWAGIWLTGFGTTNWLLYVPGVFFYFAVVTGICPGMIISNMLFGKKKPAV